MGTTLTNRLRPGPKPPFVLLAAIHPREMASAEIALRFVDYLLGRYGEDGDATWLVDEHQVVAIPFANPDARKDAEVGAWQRKNKDVVAASCPGEQTYYSQVGVVLNRNSSFRWGVVNAPTTPTCAQTYPGRSPSSEPEVAVPLVVTVDLAGAGRRGVPSAYRTGRPRRAGRAGAPCRIAIAFPVATPIKTSSRVD